MALQTAEHRINPYEEAARLGPRTVHFLAAGENSSARRCGVRANVDGRGPIMAPAHSHNRYEATIYGVDGVPGTVDGPPFFCLSECFL
jgi:hypothetical protein